MSPEVGPLWPFKRAWADGNAAAYSEIQSMLAVAMAFPGKMDGRGRLVETQKELEEDPLKGE